MKIINYQSYDLAQHKSMIKSYYVSSVLFCSRYKCIAVGMNLFTCKTGGITSY